MFTKKVLTLSILALSLLSFATCSSDDKDLDTEGPTITLVTPTNEQKYSRGKTIAVEFVLEDPSGIKEYTIDIHSAAGHSHGSAAKSLAMHNEEDENDKPWTFKEIYKDAAGKIKVEVNIETIEIAADATLGEYHFGVLATDLVGNQSIKYIDIEIVE